MRVRSIEIPKLFEFSSWTQERDCQKHVRQSASEMDFESPDVEKEFPGLYASESARKSNESDCT